MHDGNRLIERRVARRHEPHERSALRLTARREAVRQLVELVLAGKDGHPGVQLGEDAREAPHVDGHAVRKAKDDLRAAVEPGLDVLVHGSVLEARAAKVDELDLTRVE